MLFATFGKFLEFEMCNTFFLTNIPEINKEW